MPGNRPSDAPHTCPKCLSAGTIKLETTVKGPTATLLWICSRCDHRWPAKAVANH